MLELNSTQNQAEIVDQLLSLEISNAVKALIESAFRVRVKSKTNEFTNQSINSLQIRIWPPVDIDQELDLEESRIILQQAVKISGIDLVVLEYKECCMEGCQNCQNFLKEMEV